MKIKGDRPIHIVMRFADAFLSVDDTVARHAEVIKEHGTVWFGKLGKTLGADRMKKLEEQIANDVPTYLYLVQKVGSEYAVYRGMIEHLSRTLPDRQKKLVPKYYVTHGIMDQITVWTKILSLDPIDKSILKELHVAASGKSLLHSLVRSMAGMFLVQEGIGYVPMD